MGVRRGERTGRCRGWSSAATATASTTSPPTHGPTEKLNDAKSLLTETLTWSYIYDADGV